MTKETELLAAYGLSWDRLGEIFLGFLRKIERLRLRETQGFGRQVMYDSSFGCSLPDRKSVV